MSVGTQYQVGGASLDTIFQAGDDATNTLTRYYDSGGLDLRRHFAKYVSGTKAALTGYVMQDGRDIREIFQKITIYTYPIDGSTINSERWGTGSIVTAYLDVNRDGSIAYSVEPGTSIGTGYWVSPDSSTVGDGFEIRHANLSVVSGTATFSGFSSWTAVTSDRQFTLVQTVDNNASDVDFELEIRPISGSTESTTTVYLSTIKGTPP